MVRHKLLGAIAPKLQRPPLGRESPNVFSIIGNGAGAMCQIGAGVGCREIGKGSNLTGHSDGPKKKLTFFLDKLDRPKVDRPLLQNHPSIRSADDVQTLHTQLLQVPVV